MNVGIIGCGLIGHKRAASLGKAKLIACSDTDINKAMALAQKFGEVEAFDDEDALLKLGCDIVILATPHNALPGLIKKSIEFKKHVLVEKPAGRFASELDGLIELSEKNRCKVRVGFNHRYHKAFRKAKELFDSGDLGDLMFIRARYGHGGRPGYDKEWRAVPSISGGGELIDQGSHLIDLSRMFMGDFSGIEGFAETYFWDMPVDDNAFLTLRTEKGTTAFLQASCTEWKNLFVFEIYGKNGKLEINGLGGSYGIERLSYYKMLPEMGPPVTTIWEYPMADDSWQFEFEEFIKDICEDRICNPGLHDAVQNLKIVNTIYKKSGYDYNT